MINQVTLIGRVGKDPEIRYTTSNKAVAMFSIATNELGKDTTTWHNVKAWEKQAELCEQYVKKGDKLYVEGELRTRNYDDKNGVKHFITEIYGDKLELLTPKQNNVQQNAPAPNLDNVPF